MTVSRFAVGEADQKRVVTPLVDDVIRAIVDLGGNYPDVVQFLQQAKETRALSCRLEVDALPNPDRRYDHARADAAAGTDDTNYQVTTPLPNLFSNAAPQAHSASAAEAAEKGTGESSAKSRQ